MMGDLKRGRTVRSLCYLMKNYRNVRLIFIAPDDFAMGDDIKKSLQAHGVEYPGDPGSAVRAAPAGRHLHHAHPGRA